MKKSLSLSELSDLKARMLKASRFRTKLIVSEEEAEFLKKFYFKGTLPFYVSVQSTKDDRR